MKTLAYAAGTLIVWGGFCGLLYMIETIYDQAWKWERRREAAETGDSPTYGKCSDCGNRQATHLHRPHILLDPIGLCDGCYREEAMA